MVGLTADSNCWMCSSTNQNTGLQHSDSSAREMYPVIRQSAHREPVERRRRRSLDLPWRGDFFEGFRRPGLPYKTTASRLGHQEGIQIAKTQK